MKVKNYKVNPSDFKAGKYVVRIESEPQIKGKWKRSKACLLSAGLGLKGNVMLYLNDSVTVSQGDKLLIHIRRVSAEKVANPGEFNYNDYLKKQNVFTTVFIKDPGDVKLIEPASGVLSVVNAWRWKLIAKIRTAHLKENTRALLMSLVLGAADDLDESLKTCFSASGTMHVLSVSGMHIALLYILFIKMFQFARVNKRLSFVLVILLVWLYAGLTGFSPSVLRAAVICSFMVLGEAASRLSNSLNLLAGSAVLLLFFNPFLVFNPGFQLSYGAVAGIILFQRKMSDLVVVEGKVAKEVLSAVTVTIAAQLGTLGVSLFYFGQFPVYFLFANLIIVPVSSILLYAGLVYVIILLLFPPPELLNKLIDVLFDVFSVTVNYFGELPGAIMTLKIELFFVVLIYTFLIAIYLYASKARWHLAFVTSILLFGSSLYVLAEKVKPRDKSLIIFDSKAPSIGLKVNDEIQKFYVDSFQNDHKHKLFYRKDILSYNRLRIAVPDSNLSLSEVDILVITEKCKLSEKDLKKARFKTLVIAKGVKYKTVKVMEKLCEELDLPCWNINEKGAFIIKA